MRPGGKSNGESPFFETPNLSFEGRDRNVAMVAPLRGAWAFGTGQTSTVPTSNMLGPEVHASVTCVGFTNDPNSLICRKATRLVSPWRATRPIALKYQTHPDARGRGGRCAWAT